MRFTAPVESGVPNRFPRALAATRATLVRSEIASRRRFGIPHHVCGWSAFQAGPEL